MILSNLTEYAEMELSFIAIECRSSVKALLLCCQRIFFLKKESLGLYTILLDLRVENITNIIINNMTRNNILSNGVLLDTDEWYNTYL